MIICGGENLMDVIEMPGQTGARRFEAHAGGSPFNCSRALGRMGAAVGYLGTLSTDSFGQQLLAALEGCAVDHLGQRSDAPTSLAMVTLQQGQPDYRFYRTDTADRRVTHDDLSKTLQSLPQAQALHLGSIALINGPDADAWALLFENAFAAGLVTSLDPNIRPLLADGHAQTYRDRLLRMSAAARLIKLSDEDAAWWFPGLTPEAALKTLNNIAPQAVVILTQGADPVLCQWRGGAFEQPLSPVSELADTVGAGDTLMAGVLAGLDRIGALTPEAVMSADAGTLRRVIADAARAAAITCTRPGCDPPFAHEIWT